MATATSTFASYDPMNFPMSDNSIRSRENYGFFTSNTPHPIQQRMVHCLDDMDVLTLKRQYANLDLFEQSTLSNSAEDLSQIDRTPYPFQMFSQDQLDLDDDDIPYDDGSAYEYAIAIQERLKRANEEFKQDQTPIELKHPQRVSFDNLVKAVDIIVDSDEHNNSDSLLRPSITSVQEEPIEIPTSPRSDTSTHEYTVPLNDTQPRQGLSIVEKIREMQFHSSIPTEERWATNANNDSIASNRDDDVSVSSYKSNENNVDSQDLSTNTSLSTASKKAMIVSVNGRFDLQNEDDYTAKERSQSTKKPIFLPTPPTEPKQKQLNSAHRSSLIRPKSSSIEKKTQIETAGPQRPKSASSLKSIESYVEKPSSGVDFAELLRKAAEKKRAQLREERRKKEEAEEKRQQELAKAKESYERWLQEKDTERKRIREEKRLEQQEQEIRQAEKEKELNELREKKFQEWLQKKDQQSLLANEFKKLKANDEYMTSGGGSPSSNHRAFQKWLRQKYLKSLEEKRQECLDTRRQRRRRHHRSIKRNQLQKDIQLARTFGYS